MSARRVTPRLIERVQGLVGAGWNVSRESSRRITCARELDSEESCGVTFVLLSKLSELCGTKLIDLVMDYEAGQVWSEYTYDGGSSRVTIVIDLREPDV